MSGPVGSTRLGSEILGVLDPVVLEHPPATFEPTAATRISLKALADQGWRLGGRGIDWGCGVGGLAIVAARLPDVEGVVGLDLVPENVQAARRNAHRNGVGLRARFYVADSFDAVDEEGRRTLAELEGRGRFVLANPPASDGDDGLSFRRAILRGARRYLEEGGEAWFQVSGHYGERRIGALADDVPGYRWAGLLTESCRAPLASGALLTRYLRFNAAEEERGGLPYELTTPSGDQIDARTALDLWTREEIRPLTRWQVHRFVREGDRHPGGREWSHRESNPGFRLAKPT